MTTTSAEFRGRARKADRLVGTALTAGMTPELVATDADARAALVAAAGVREPSLDTWRLVVRRLVAAEPSVVDRLVEDIYAAHKRVLAARQAAE